MASFHGHYPAKDYPYQVTTNEYDALDPHKRVSHVSTFARDPQRLRESRYRPFAHRTLYFVLVGAVTLGLIGVLEYSVHVLTHGSFQVDLPSTSDVLSHVKRQDDPIAAATTATPEWSAIGPGDISIVQGGQAAPTTSRSTFQTNPSAYASGGAATTLHPSAEPTSSYASGGAATTIAPHTTSTTVASAVVVTVNPGPSNTLTAPAVLTQTTYQTVVTVASATHATRLGGQNGTEGYLESDVPLMLVDKPENYFLGVYAPVLIAIILQGLVQYLYNCTRLMDSFNMLTQEEGVPLKNFFWNEHLGSTSPMAPLGALFRRRWTLLWTSTIYFASQLLIAFASELVAIHPSYHKIDPTNKNSGIVRGRSLWVNTVLVRIIQGLLVFMFIQLINVRLLLRRDKSLLQVNPASIATIASLVSHPEVAHDLMYIDQNKANTQAIERLAERRYRLQTYFAPDGSECYGIVPVGEGQYSPSRLSSRFSMPFSTTGSSRGNGTTSAKSTLRNDCLCIGLITGSAMTLFGIILAYILNHDSTTFEHFMDAQGFGPRFLLAVLALILKSPLQSFWARTTASVPWRRLADKARRPHLDILTPVPVYRTPLGTLIYTIRRKAWFATYLGVLAGLIVEVLLVLLPGVPFHAQQFHLAALASWYGSLACLALVFVGCVAAWIRILSKNVPWPRPPNSFGTVALYTAGTSLSQDVAPLDAVLPPNALFEFRRRNGRWLCDYSGAGEGE